MKSHCLKRGMTSEAGWKYFKQSWGKFFLVNFSMPSSMPRSWLLVQQHLRKESCDIVCHQRYAALNTGPATTGGAHTNECRNKLWPWTTSINWAELPHSWCLFQQGLIRFNYWCLNASLWGFASSTLKFQGWESHLLPASCLSQATLPASSSPTPTKTF